MHKVIEHSHAKTARVLISVLAAGALSGRDLQVAQAFQPCSVSGGVFLQNTKDPKAISDSIASLADTYQAVLGCGSDNPHQRCAELPHVHAPARPSQTWLPMSLSPPGS